MILAQNYNQSGKTFSHRNFNYSSDGKVDFADLVILAQRYNHVLAGATTIAPTATVSSASAVMKVMGRQNKAALHELA